MTVLVLGATGFIGHALVAALVQRGATVRAASRRPRATTVGVEHVGCDVHDPSALRRVLVGVDCVYYLVHSMGEGAADFRRVEHESARHLGQAASECGCQRIVYLGGVAPQGPPSEHLASRLDVGAVLRAGAVPALELRAAMIVGNGSASWQILRDLALRLPFMVLPRWLESKSCPIALEDVVTALLDAGELPLDESAWYDLPGPEVLSAHEMITIVAELEHRRIPMLRVPLLSPRLSAGWLKLISSVKYELARELVLGLREDLLPRDRRYWELTSHAPTWTFRAAARRALETEPAKTGLKSALGAWEEQLIRRFGRDLA